jgi:hypothetical protein
MSPYPILALVGGLRRDSHNRTPANALDAPTLGQPEAFIQAKIESAKSEIIKWIFGAIGFQTLFILGAVIALARIAHP